MKLISRPEALLYNLGYGAKLRVLDIPPTNVLAYVPAPPPGPSLRIRRHMQGNTQSHKGSPEEPTTTWCWAIRGLGLNIPPQVSMPVWVCLQL